MPGESSSAAAWSTRLEPARKPPDLPRRPDDVRLGEITEFWQGNPDALRAGRAVLLGFPQDEGVRRNQGREGAAQAPDAIRSWLYRLTPCAYEPDVDLGQRPPLDLGNLRLTGGLEETQQALGEVIAAVLRPGAVPVVLGGGHETALGHYLGYVAARRPVSILNFDAHLDVRPLEGGLGHSGSPFRQIMEHPEQPLPGERYVCLGAQPHSVSPAHRRYARARGCVIRWADRLRSGLSPALTEELDRLAVLGSVYVSLDADAVRMSDVPGVSAPNPAGLEGTEVIACARVLGCHPPVSSFDLVEINPRLDRDGQSTRWAALVVWNFLIGLGSRPLLESPGGSAD
jgi:formiminoglutamase